MFGEGGGSEGVDETFAHRSMDGFGAFILGRNMFGPVRGEWLGLQWEGLVGRQSALSRSDVRPDAQCPRADRNRGRHHVPLRHGRDPRCVERARNAAGARDVKIGGGVSTVRQYLQAGLIDELHFALSPVLLGRGEAMFEGLDLPALGYRVMKSTATDLATHVVLRR